MTPTPSPAPLSEMPAATATVYLAENIVKAIATAKARNCDRLCLANRRGMVIEIMADDLLAAVSGIAGLTSALNKSRELVAAWMMRNSYATGHGDNISDLLGELDWQHKARAETAESRVKVLEEALRPFTTQHVLYVHDDESIIAWTPVIDARFGVSVGDLRRAAASLDQVDRT